MALRFLRDGYFVGTVGIGTASPDAKLDVRSTSRTAPVVLKLGNGIISGDNGVIVSQIRSYINNSNAAADELARIQVENGSGSHDDGNLSFWTRDGLNNVDAAKQLQINGKGVVELKKSGTAALPVLVLGEDVDTGFFRPSSNNIALSTTGVERIRVTSAGNVGIGTTSPGSPLSVVGSYSSSDEIVEIGGGTGINTDFKLKIGAVDQDYIWFQSVKPGDNYYDLVFNPTAGNVGIGTTSPGAKLNVAGDVLIDSGEYISWGTVGATSIEGSTASNKLQFRTSSTDRMIINDTGVGIGTTSPSQKLEVSTSNYNVSKFVGNTDDGTGYVGAVVEIESNNDARGRGVYLTHRLSTDTTDSEWYAGVPYTGDGYSIGNAAYGTSINSDTGPAHKDQSKLFILESGNVGIGTSSPGAKLHLSGISQTGTQTPFRIENDTSNTKFQIKSISGDYNLQFKNAGNTTRVFLNSNGNSYFNGGNVGIGTDSPLYKLQVQGSVALDVMPTHETEGSVRIGRYDSNTSRYNDIKSYVSSTAASNYLKFSVHGGVENATVDVMTLNGSGNATFSAQAFSVATSSGDASSTLTTKGYVDGLITGATIYRGAWQAGISATSSAATTASTTLTVTAAILDADGGTPALVGAVVTGAGITGIVKVTSVTSSTVYVLDTAITATATAYIFSPIYGAPDLSGVTETSGYYYICSEAGSATPNGANSEPNTWAVGDWCIYNDVSGTGQWQKIDNSSVLSGAGTGQTVALWEGPSSITDSETLGNAPITVSGNNATFAGTIDSGNIFIDNSGTPQLKITDSGNAGGGGASGKIIYANTDGNAMGLGYTEDLTATSDFIISSDAGSTYGGYLGLAAAAIDDPSSIILDPKTYVYVTKALGIGTTSPSELLHISSTGDAVAIIEADSNNDNEDANPKLTLKQDGAVVVSSYAINGTVDNAFTGALVNGAYIESSTSFQLAPGGALSTTFLTDGKVGIGIDAPVRTLHVNSGDLDVVSLFESTDTLAKIEVKDDDTSSFIVSENNESGFGPFGARATTGNLRINNGTHNGGGVGYAAFGGTPTSGTKFRVFSSYDTSGDANMAGVTIDINPTGTTALTGDKTIRGLYVDIDSDATGGDTSDELRIYGIDSSIIDTGDADLVYSSYNFARSSMSVAGQQTTQLIGTRSNVQAYNTAGLISSAMGTYSTAAATGAGDINAIYAGRYELAGGTTDITIPSGYALYGRAEPGVGFTGTYNNIHAGYFEVESETGNTFTNSFGVKSIIDHNGGTMTNAYQFYGVSSGTIGTSWGVYSSGAAKHYLSGDVGIGTLTPGYKLDVSGSANNDDIAIRINNTFDDNLATSNPTSALWLSAASNNGYLRVHGAPANTAAKHQIDLGSTAGSSFLTFSPGAAERMRIATDGAIQFNDYGAGILVTDASGNITAEGGTWNGPFLPLTAGSTEPLSDTLYGTGATFGDTTVDVATVTIEGGQAGILDIWRNGTNASYQAIRFRDDTNANTEASIGWGPNNLRLNGTDYIVATTGGDERIRIDSSGNFGIGTSTPTSLLEISQQLSAASTIDYPYTISSRDDANSINQAGGEGVGIKFRIAGNAGTTPGDSLVGASIAAIREMPGDTDSSTGLGFFVTQNDETLDEALRIDHDRNIKFNAYGVGTLVSDTDGNITVSSGGGQGGPYLKDTTDTFTGSLTIVGDIRGSGQQLILNAGESYNYATAQTSELVYLNAEAGLQVNSSPDNWATGWAGRNTAFINRADASSSLPGNLSIAAGSQLFLDGGGNTYISEDIADRLRFFTGGAEFMRFTEDTANLISFYQPSAFSGLVTAPTPANATDDNTLATTAFVKNLIAELPAGLIYKGAWNADTNDPTLAAGGGEIKEGTTTTLTADKLIDSSGAFTTAPAVAVNDRVRVVTPAGPEFALVSSVDSATQLTLASDIVTATGEAYIVETPAFLEEGNYYIVSDDGTTDLNGITDWKVGDWVVASSTNVWQKIDNSSVLDGSGTGGKIPIWEGAGDSITLGDSVITQSAAGDLDVGGGITADYFRTDLNTGDYSLITRSSAGNAPLYVQSADSNTNQPIAFFSYGDASANAGTKVLSVAKDLSYFLNTNVGIGLATPTSKLHINQSVTNPDLDLPNSFAVEIDSNHSGSAATTGDREQGGLYIDVDSSTTGGDTQDEHRLYGINNNVNHSGDSDLVYAISNRAEQNTTAGTTTNVIGSYSAAISDGGSGAVLTNITGAYGSVDMQDATPVSNSYGGQFLNNTNANRTGATTNSFGIKSEIQIGSTSAYTSLFAAHFSIDSNAAYTATNSYLLYLDYAGSSLATNTYAIYSVDDVKSYHRGDFGIGTATPDAKLDVEAVTNPTIRLTNSTGSLGAADVGTLEFFSKDASTGASRVLSSIVCLNEAASPSVPDGQLAFKTSLGGANAQPATEKMRIDPIGQVGIGTISPDGKLEVTDDSSLSSYVTQYTDDADGAELVIRTARGTQAVPVQYNTGDSAGRLLFQAYTSSGSFKDAASIESVMESGNANAYGGLRFNYLPAVSPYTLTEGMRLNMAGDVGIGGIDPSSKLQVDGGIQMADDTDTAVAAKAGTMRYRTGTEYVEVTGVELVTNGGFDADESWTLGSLWTISGGKANYTNTSTDKIYQAIALTNAVTYRVKFTVSGVSGSSDASIWIGNSAGNTNYLGGTYKYYANGDFEEIFTMPSSQTTFTFYSRAAGSSFSLDNVTLMEVTEEDASYADMCMQTGASTYEWVNIVRNTY